MTAYYRIEMRVRRWLATVWLCFLARAIFYCAALPLWEGYDEYAHFAVVQRMALRGEPLVARDAPVGQDIALSLALAPVPWELRTLPPPSVTHDDFWRLPPAERARRESDFRAIPPAAALLDAPGNLRAYEGLQGPLFGWVMAPLLLAARHAHLATQLLLVRLFAVALVSLIIPLTFLIARHVFRDDALALGCAAIVSVMPEFLIDAARAGNDGIAALLFTLIVWLSLEVQSAGITRTRALLLGVALGLGLIAKAYVLTAVPCVAALLVWKCRRPSALLVPLATAAIGGWWYLRNLLTTHTLTGMWESALLPNAGLAAQLRQIPHIPWRVAIDSIMLSHLYFGAWSSLTIRSWMYHLLYLMIALAAVGLFFPRPRREAPRPPTHWRSCQPDPQPQREAPQPPAPSPQPLLLLFFLLFWAGQLYHVIPMFMIWNIPTSMGCYLYAVVAAEVVLCVAGLRALSPQFLRRWVAPIGVALFALLDLYTIHMVALPYYTGLIAHRPDGPVAAFHPVAANLSQMLPRLAAFKSGLLSEFVLAALWIAYAAATIGLVAISFWISRTPPLRQSHSAAASLEIGVSGPTSPVPPPPTTAR
jgi:4-amino-4-deoxy-L-arabinose transferase-like glycosyltransferase